ncbi:hypothetical protein ACE6H2_024381 [Prunus campanulata]
MAHLWQATTRARHLQPDQQNWVANYTIFKNHQEPFNSVGGNQSGQNDSDSAYLHKYHPTNKSS